MLPLDTSRQQSARQDASTAAEVPSHALSNRNRGFRPKQRCDQERKAATPDPLVALAGALLTTSIGLAAGLWRRLTREQRRQQALEQQIQGTQSDLRAVMQQLEATQEELLRSKGELHSAQQQLDSRLSELQLTRSQLELLQVELRQTKHYLASAQRDVQSKAGQIRALQSGADYDDFY